MSHGRGTSHSIELGKKYHTNVIWYDVEEKDIIMYLTENDELKIYPINTVEKIKPSDVKQKDIIKLYVLNENNELTLIDNSRIKNKVLYNIKYIFKPALTIQEKLGGGAK